MARHLVAICCWVDQDFLSVTRLTRLTKKWRDRSPGRACSKGRVHCLVSQKFRHGTFIYFYDLLWSCTCTIAKGKMAWTDNCGVSEKVSQQLCCLHETLLWMITKNHWTGTVFDKNCSRPKPDLVTGRGKHSWLRWWGLGQWGFHFHVRSLEELGLLAATLLFFQLVWNETKYAASEILNANCLPKSKGLRWLSTEFKRLICSEATPIGGYWMASQPCLVWTDMELPEPIGTWSQRHSDDG